MKHFTSDFAKGFYACLFLMSVGLFFAFSNKTTQKNTDEHVSEAISWNDALAMRNKYLASSPLKTEMNNQGTITLKSLEGFSIQADHLIEIIQNNKAGGTADAVVFYLGAEEPASGFSLPRYNLIAVGRNSSGLMIPTNERDKSDPSKSSVFDKADPCPPFCPEN